MVTDAKTGLQCPPCLQIECSFTMQGWDAVRDEAKTLIRWACRNGRLKKIRFHSGEIADYWNIFPKTKSFDSLGDRRIENRLSGLLEKY